MKSLIDHLATLYPDSSRRTLKNWLAGGRVRVNGQVERKATLPIEGEEVTLGRYEVRPFCGIHILYEDPHLIAISKPAGLLSFPLDTPGSRHALGLLRHHLEEPKIQPVHRLDRETSGVMVFARSERGHEGLDALFEGRNLEREYIAVVEGHLAEDKGTWESLLLERADLSVASHPKGKRAVTHFEVIGRTPKLSHLRLKLETGRKHQIRVHCSEAGHPVVGDKRYGGSFDPIERLALHAHTLAFNHPVTGKPLHFTAKLPTSFQRVGLT
ncbi:MAG: RluA family pseudouridine synthase [Parachlamydiales bacterium]